MSSKQANLQTLLDNERASLWYYPNKKIIHHQFRTFVYGREFRDVLETGLEAFERFGARKWLSDDRGSSAPTEEDVQWASNDWAPRVMAAGWKYWAIVMPEKVIGQLSLRRWIKMYAEKGVTVRAFTSPDEALAWLETQ
jgi:hypothetical protein